MSGKGSTFLHVKSPPCNLFSQVTLVVLLQTERIAVGGDKVEERGRGKMEW